MPRETAEQFAAFVLAWYDSKDLYGKLVSKIRTRDLETAEEVRERASKHRMVRRDGELSECVCGWKPFSCNIAAEWKSHILSVPLDPPAETGSSKAVDAPCPNCDGQGGFHHHHELMGSSATWTERCPDCRGTGLRAQGKGEEVK